MTTFPQSRFWRITHDKRPEVLVQYGGPYYPKRIELPQVPDAVPGWGPFNLGPNHWSQPAAEEHDRFYVAHEQGLCPEVTKAEADVRFFRAAMQAMTVGVDDADFETLANRMTQLSWMWLAIRSPIGAMAWNT